MSNTKEKKPCQKNQIIEFTTWVAENKAIALTWGAGWALGSRDKKLNEFLQQFQKKNNLDYLFRIFEYQLSLYGAGVLYFDKKNQVRMSNGIFPISVGTNGEVVERLFFIETSKNSKSKSWYKFISIDSTGISYSASLSIPTAANTGFLNKEPEWPKEIKNLGLETFEDNKWGKELNGVYCLNTEVFNPQLWSVNFRTPDHLKLKQEFYDDLQEAYNFLYEDLVVSQNKLITVDDELKQKSDNEVRKKVISNIIIRTARGGVLGGKEVGTELLKGSPNAPILWQNFWNLWEYGLFQCGYSSTRGSSAYATATSDRFSKDLDLIKTEIKKRTRRNQWIKLFDRIIIENEYWDGKGARPYYFVIHDGMSHDKESSLAHTKQLEDFGYIKHSEAIQRTFPTYTEQEALEKMKEIVKQKQDFPDLDPNNVKGEQDSYKSQEQAVIKPDKKTSEKQEKNEQER